MRKVRETAEGGKLDEGAGNERGGEKISPPADNSSTKLT